MKRKTTTMTITKERLKQIIKEELDEMNATPLQNFDKMERMIDDAADKIVMEVNSLAEIVGLDKAMEAITKASAKLEL